MKTKPIILLSILMLAAVSPIIAGEPKPEEFVTVFGANLPQLDPHRSIYSSEAQILSAVYEGLFTYDPSSLDPVEAAVSSWKKSPDGKEYTFTIRDDAKWSDGTPLVAKDFRDSWLRMLDINGEYSGFFDIISGAKAYRLKQDENPDHIGIKAAGSKTLVVTLNRPAAYFTRLLCHHSFAPIHPSMLSAKDWTAAIPFPVNGPYRFTKFGGNELYLERNPYYWDARSVSIPRLKMIFTDDDTLASKMFNDESAHWLDGPGNYDTIIVGNAIQINPIFSTNYWFFNCAAAPWDDSRVRRALALLVPWTEVRDPAHYMAPATTLVLPLPGYSEAKGIEAKNQDEAMKLLSEAGFPNGAGLPAITLLYVDGKDNQRITSIFKKAWEALPGVKVNLESMPASQYYEAIGDATTKGRFTLAHTTWIGDFADPEAFLQMWTANSALNDAHYDDPAFTEMLKTSYAQDGKERMSTLAKAETILLQGAAVLPIYHSFASSVIDLDYIGGWYQNALDIHPYKYLKFQDRPVSPNVARSPRQEGMVSEGGERVLAAL
jgi:peptide/nickel transport system substrate-binding protein/oligopeptide transport system substrate-binding protein